MSFAEGTDIPNASASKTAHRMSSSSMECVIIKPFIRNKGLITLGDGNLDMVTEIFVFTPTLVELFVKLAATEAQ